MTMKSLHDLIAAKDWQGATEKLARKPERANKSDSARCLPLHRACEGGAPPELIRALIVASPSNINNKDKAGRTPLDVALAKYPFNPNPDDYRAIIEMLQRGETKHGTTAPVTKTPTVFVVSALVSEPPVPYAPAKVYPSPSITSATQYLKNMFTSLTVTRPDPAHPLPQSQPPKQVQLPQPPQSQQQVQPPQPPVQSPQSQQQVQPPVQSPQSQQQVQPPVQSPQSQQQVQPPVQSPQSQQQVQPPVQSPQSQQLVQSPQSQQQGQPPQQAQANNGTSGSLFLNAALDGAGQQFGEELAKLIIASFSD